MTTRGRAFQKGQSGNPAGRPKGSRAKTALKLDAILEGDAEEVARKAVAMAKAGDTVAMRLVLDRLCPPRKDRPVQFELPDMQTAKDVAGAIAAVVRAVAAGDLTPDEASTVASVIEMQRRAIDTHDLADRLAAIEARLAGEKGAQP